MSLFFAFLIGVLCTFTHFQKKDHEGTIRGRLVNSSAVTLLYISDIFSGLLGLAFCGLIAFRSGIASGAITLAILALGYFIGGICYGFLYPFSRVLGIISIFPVAILFLVQYLR